MVPFALIVNVQLPVIWFFVIAMVLFDPDVALVCFAFSALFLFFSLFVSCLCRDLTALVLIPGPHSV